MSEVPLATDSYLMQDATSLIKKKKARISVNVACR